MADTTGAFIALAYGLPWLYLHGYFGWYYRRAQRAVSPLDRPRAYEQGQRTHRGLVFTAYLFPVGLALYWPWYRRYLATLRDTPFACPECAQPMHKLDNTTEKQHLGPGQQVEETSRAIDYDVWACPAGHYVPLAYLNLDSDATVCPACHHRTLSPGRLRVEKVATRHTEGWGWRVEKCRFCEHEKKIKETIPRLPDPTQRAAASSSSSSWGGSSSSSSGSRSTSSGGSSGGGGAGSSW